MDEDRGYDYYEAMDEDQRYEAMMGLDFYSEENNYRVIILGTGLKENLLNFLLSREGVKVLQLEDNEYSGGETAYPSLNQLWKRFKRDGQPPENLGPSKRYSVPMIPKLMEKNGTLARLLSHTGKVHMKAPNRNALQFFTNVPGTDTMNFIELIARRKKLKILPDALDGRFFYDDRKVHMEAPNYNACQFFTYVLKYDADARGTHKGMDLTKMTFKELIANYHLDDNIVDFIGQALHCHIDDGYLNEPAQRTVMEIKLQLENLVSSQGGSQYCCPIRRLPQEIYEPNVDVKHIPISKVEYGKGMYVVQSGDEVFMSKYLVCDPSRIQDMPHHFELKKVGKVARAIAIMSRPIPNTSGSTSVQVTLPRRLLRRKYATYLFSCSDSPEDDPKDDPKKFIAFLSTEAETDDPKVELKPGVDLLGSYDEIFYEIHDRYGPLLQHNCLISSSYDATTDIESTVIDVLEMYTVITGKTLAEKSRAYSPSLRSSIWTRIATYLVDGHDIVRLGSACKSTKFLLTDMEVWAERFLKECNLPMCCFKFARAPNWPPSKEIYVSSFVKRPTPFYFRGLDVEFPNQFRRDRSLVGERDQATPFCCHSGCMHICTGGNWCLVNDVPQLFSLYKETDSCSVEGLKPGIWTGGLFEVKCLECDINGPQNCPDAFVLEIWHCEAFLNHTANRNYESLGSCTTTMHSNVFVAIVDPYEQHSELRYEKWQPMSERPYEPMLRHFRHAVAVKQNLTGPEVMKVHYEVKRAREGGIVAVRVSWRPDTGYCHTLLPLSRQRGRRSYRSRQRGRGRSVR